MISDDFTSFKNEFEHSEFFKVQENQITVNVMIDEMS
jgi:hypothetical protein